MTIEWIRVKPVGFRKPEPWYREPCCSIGKTGVTFNGQFLKAFNLAQGDLLQVGYDRIGSKLVFRAVSKEDAASDNGAYKIGRAGDEDCTSAKINSKTPAKVFEAQSGRTFTAAINKELRVIECDMTKPV